ALPWSAGISGIWIDGSSPNVAAASGPHTPGPAEPAQSTAPRASSEHRHTVERSSHVTTIRETSVQHWHTVEHAAPALPHLSPSVGAALGPFAQASSQASAGIPAAAEPAHSTSPTGIDRE